MKRYKVKRYLIEHFEVEASNKQEAILKAEWPNRIEVKKETAVSLK